MEHLRPFNMFSTYDSAPEPIYKIEEVKSIMAKLEKIEFKANDFIFDDGVPFEQEMLVFNNKIGQIITNISKQTPG